MLDFKSKKLLNIINGECKGAEYKVFSFTELALFYPQKFGVSEEEVRSVLKTLFSRGYISIRYEDDNEVCLCIMPDGRAIVENEVQESVDRLKTVKGFFVYSFIGGALGGVFSALIFVALYFLFGGR
jgi:hypothetical protein